MNRLNSVKLNKASEPVKVKPNQRREVKIKVNKEVGYVTSVTSEHSCYEELVSKISLRN